MLRKKISKILFLVLWFAAFATVEPAEFTVGKVIAYPNPFSPLTDTLTIKPNDSSAFNGTVEYKIYNYNEKEVFSGQTSNSVIYWNGHSADGSAVVPGLYFIKIIQTKSDYSTGTTMIKLIVK